MSGDRPEHCRGQLTMCADCAASLIGGTTGRWLADKARSGEVPFTRVRRSARFTTEQVEAIVADRASAPLRSTGLRPTVRSQARRAS